MRGVSIVICCNNSAGRIAETLSFILKQNVAEELPWELVLVDNGSTDLTAEVAQEAWTSSVPLRVLQEPKLGVGNARMRGLREAAYDIICFVDDDNHLSPDWVENVYRKMEQYPDAGAIGGTNLAQYEKTPPEWFEPYKACYAVGSQAPVEGELLPDNLVLWSAGMAIRRAAWEDLERAGFLSMLTGRAGVKLNSGEDSELSYMLRILGWKLYFFPTLTLQHFIPESKLNWRYLCRLKHGFGAASVRLMMYRRIYQYLQTGEQPRKKAWWSEILNDGWALIRRPAVLGATVFNFYEGNNHILNMHALLGRLSERLHLLQRADKIEAELWQKYAHLRPGRAPSK